METSQPNPRPPENVKSGVADAQRTGETNGGAAAPKIVPSPPGAPPPQPAADERVRTLSTFHRVPVWAAMLAALACALLIGWVNGQLVVRTGLPSFIVTLGFLFILRGLTLALSIIFANRTIVSGIGDLAAQDPVASFLFSGTFANDLFTWAGKHGWITTLDDGRPLVRGIPKVILWWAFIAVASSYRLTHTRFGNWIFAVGGDANAAQNVGVPVRRVKVSLFMFTALCAWIFAMLQVCDVGSATADRGLQKEFEAIIAAVIGGTLLTGRDGPGGGGAPSAAPFGRRPDARPS